MSFGVQEGATGLHQMTIYTAVQFQFIISFSGDIPESISTALNAEDTRCILGMIGARDWYPCRVVQVTGMLEAKPPR